LPRDLSDVLHYFMPELEDEETATRAQQPLPTSSAPREPSSPRRPTALPLVGVPIGDRDVVRAAFTWNLVVEIARLGGKASLVVAGESDCSPLFPASGVDAAGAELIHVEVDNLAQLHQAAAQVAATRAAEAEAGGVVFVRVAPSWLSDASRVAGLLRWVLLFSRANPRDLLETYAISQRILAASPDAHIGVTIHGARSADEAGQSFDRLSASTKRHLDHELQSYGLIEDDLDVYRAIVAQRAIGLAHPRSTAACALRDVARMLVERARKHELA